MTHSTSSILTALGASLLVAAPAAPAAEISPSTIDNGGVTSAGGGYAVTGSIGQPDAGSMSGGSFALTGGLVRAGGATELRDRWRRFAGPSAGVRRR